MTAEEIVKAAREAGFSSSEIFQRLAAFKRLIDAAAAAEREACIAAIQGQIDHAHINELRLVPRFGKRLGEIAVRADDLEAALDGLRARGQA